MDRNITEMYTKCEKLFHNHIIRVAKQHPHRSCFYNFAIIICALQEKYCCDATDRLIFPKRKYMI